jgi:hypothetical protein
MKQYTPLRLSALDKEDLHVISACLQDALVPVSGLKYDEQNQQFHFVANRFCWECEPELVEETPYYSRVATGLAFHNVTEVQQKCLEPTNDNELINLLTIQKTDDNCIHLIFSGGSEIKLMIKDICCHLKDMDEPYPTKHKPSHIA